MTKSLTQSLKQKDLPILIQRDNGFNCLYCKKPLTGDYIFEHLNSDRLDNRIENLALSCQSCNITKITDYDLDLIAQEKLKQNEAAGLKYLEDGTAHENNSSEIEINKALYSFTEQYLSEQITAHVNILFDDTLTELTYLAQKRFGHGSEATFRKYLKSLTCKVSELQVVKDDKIKKIICRRGVLN
ncbi:MAG: HNH endonuclease [Thaumarchaeota archaeon]|nr:HNH endonuclease [Nitrososphaerota archaeon]